MAASNNNLSSDARTFYRDALGRLQQAGVPFLVGGAFAFERYTGIHRHTKDFDLFVRRDDLEPAFEALEDPGWSSAMIASHWLAKVHCGDLAIDMIFASGNGVSHVDHEWFERAVDDEVLDLPVKLCSAEDVLWTKAFIHERERYDGADVAHLILRADLDWDVLIDLFDAHWQVLLAHAVLFCFSFPSERDRIPRRVMEVLLQRLKDNVRAPAFSERVCYGTLLSRAQYLMAVNEWDFLDGRLAPEIALTEKQVRDWTDAIDKED